jgi:hypothetical protein
MVSALTPIRSVPTQDKIDALGAGKTARDREARFELADENVTLVGGVALRAVGPARHTTSTPKTCGQRRS